MIRRADPVLAVHDLEVSARWYESVLGCERVDAVPGLWVFCRAAGTTFRLGLCPDVPPARELGDHSFVAYLHVDDVDAAYERAVAAGADVISPPADEPWGMREMALRSPDGHRFRLGQPRQPA